MIQTSVYVLECDHGVKVGITTQTIVQRVADLERATGLHVDVVRTYPVAGRSQAYTIEQAAHWMLRDARTVGEWFHCHPFDATEAIESLLRGGIPVGYFARNEVAA